MKQDLLDRGIVERQGQVHVALRLYF
jgi:hypothetical protein